MSETVESHTTDKPAEAEATRGSGVMDVLPPRAADGSAAPRAEIAPPADVLAQIETKEPLPPAAGKPTLPPSEPQPAAAEPEATPPPKAKHKGKAEAPPKPVKPPKQTSPVVPAIVATVVVVCLLVALSVYAYLQSKQ